LRCAYTVIFLIVGVLTFGAIGDHMDQYFQNCKVDVGFVLDGSGSVGTDDWQVTLEYVKQFADSVSFSPEFTQIGVVTFGNDASLDIKLGDHGPDCDAFKASVGQLGYRDENTNTAAGIRVAREQLFNADNGDRADAPNVMIIITDGYPTREVSETLPQAYQTVNEGTTIFTIGIGPQIDMQQLFMIASNITGHSWTVGDYGHLSDEIYAVLGATCTVAITPDIVTDPDPCDVTTSCYDIAFVLDGSGSVGQANWNSVLQFLLEYSQMRIDGLTRIGVVTFGNEASIEIDFNQGSTLASIQGALDGIGYRDQNTNTASGLRMACTELYTNPNLGARADCPDRLVLITDGLPTMEVSQTYIEAAGCRSSGIDIFSLGVGEEIDYQTLYMLANNDSSRVRQIDEFAQVAFGTEQLAVTGGCECPIFDLILVLDGSGSMGENNWVLMKQFAIDLISSFDVGPAKTRVAVVTYSTEAGVEFLLNAYNTTAQYETAILAIAMHGQRTNIADGLKMVTQHVLSEANGDRPDVDNLVVVVSDGQANVQEDEIFSSATAIQTAGTPIMAIGVGMDADMVQMRKVASQPCYNFLRFYDDMASLVLDVHHIQADLCNMMGHLDEQLTEPTLEIHEYANNDNTLILIATDGDNDDWNTITEFVASQFDQYMEDITSYNIGVYTANAEIALGSNVVSMPDAIRGLSNPGATPIDIISLTYIQNLISIADDPVSYNVIILTNSLTEEQADALKAGEAILRNSGVTVIVMSGGYRDANLFGNWYMDGVATVSLDEMSHFEQGPISLFDMVAFLSVPVVGWCDFEDWTHTTGEICGTQSTNDDFDWTVQSGGTPSRHTGPESAQQGEYYIFIEASSPREYGDKAMLILPFQVESSTHVMCITFYYHMRGFHTGTLQVVHIHADGHPNILWQMSGPQGDDWQMGTTTLNMSQGDKVAFRAIRAGAFSGDIAVDAVAFHASMCLSNMPS